MEWKTIRVVVFAVVALSIQSSWGLQIEGQSSKLILDNMESVMDINANNQFNASKGALVVCYFTPTGYFPSSKVPSDACTHIIYAFGTISSASPTIIDPTADQKKSWATLTSLRQQNPSLKVMLSLQEGFPYVVGPDSSKMKQFAINCAAYLRKFGLDGIDLDWEPYPTSSDKGPFASFVQILRAAFNQEARTTGNSALLLSLALPNNQAAAQKAFDIPTISSTVDFGTAMTYDFHLYSKRDTNTGYNSPLFTPDGDNKYYSSAAMAQYYLSQGMAPRKLLLGIPTYGRSWKLASASSHGFRSPAVGKGDPGPYRHLTGVYTYPDSCLALKQGAQSVYNSTLGARYLYQGITWVAYDDVTTVQQKSGWVKQNGLGGFGVWALHIDDIDEKCGLGPLPLIAALRNSFNDNVRRPRQQNQQQQQQLPQQNTNGMAAEAALRAVRNVPKVRIHNAN